MFHQCTCVPATIGIWLIILESTASRPLYPIKNKIYVFNPITSLKKESGRRGYYLKFPNNENWIGLNKYI